MKSGLIRVPAPGRLRFLLLAAAVAAAPVAAAPAAEEEATGPDIRTLDSVVVVASRAAEPLSQVVASVAQVDREQLDRYLVRDPDSLVRYVPGVAVTSEPDRFGTRGFAIRGLEGNRVRILVDGIPLPDSYSVGQFSSAGRDLVDLEAIDRVEIQRGPASTLYGSDALAGVVAFRTFDPEDLLARTGSGRYFGLRAGFDSLDDSHLLGASWAAGVAPGWQAMALAARRSGSESGNRAWRAEDAANPADFTRESVLAKLVRDADDGRYTLAFDGARESRETAVNSMRFGAGRYATTYRVDGDDEQQRLRASLTGEWAPGLRWLDALEAQLHWQRTDVRQDTAQYRLADTATPFESLRWRRFDYQADSLGLGLVGQSRHEGRWGRHWHVFGMDIALQRYEGLREGVETNLETGATNTVILGEAMPVRDFPTSDADSLALFWQDAMSIGERLAVILD
ncbi:MAG: TonB-dependent receptor, partial [Gammaproteobacteria bacterium]|nr:TonB-dependent receptor [Gammaproteobacteria bacterium]